MANCLLDQTVILRFNSWNLTNADLRSSPADLISVKAKSCSSTPTPVLMLKILLKYFDQRFGSIYSFYSFKCLPRKYTTSLFKRGPCNKRQFSFRFCSSASCLFKMTDRFVYPAKNSFFVRQPSLSRSKAAKRDSALSIAVGSGSGLPFASYRISPGRIHNMKIFSMYIFILPGLTPSISSIVSMMMAISFRSITPSLSTS